jgi:3-oxosteroid 1-dehydrogenase
MVDGWSEEVDFVVIGSGGGSFCAGLVLRDLGRSVLVLEKTELVGGSTAMSGGVLWIPNHPLQARAGVADSFEQARDYLNATVGEAGPGSSPARKDAFLRTGPQLVSYLEEKGMPFRRCDGWSDYYDELPGGCARGRSLAMELFDTAELGEWAGRLRRGGRDIPVRWPETRWLMLAKRTPAGMLAAMRLAARLAIMKLTGRKLVGMGAAIQGRMLKAALAAGVEVRAKSPVTGLVEEGGRVVGVTVDRDGAALKIRARLGVLINAGGFSRNLEMRKQYGPQPASVDWTHANPGDTGEALRFAMDLGAAVDQVDQAVWLVTSLPPGGGRAFHVFDISKPHIILVDGKGRRFTNESGSYMENGQRMYRNGAVPAWAIFESRHRERYPWGMGAAPGMTPDKWFSEGYMKRADTLDALARACELDPGALQQTVERFNGFAQSGRDLDFKRGDRAYDRVFGDPTVKPNPCLGAIERGPFYAVKVFPGDVGTFGGLVTDEHARVLRSDGAAIEGLYATGNCTASVMGACYPGAGASIGASFVFGYLAARHAGHATAND